MNFAIFDDDFDQEKINYLKEIYDLSDEVISKEKRGDWNLFVSSNLVNTRNYYIIITALKTMKNVDSGENFDNAMFKSFSFMPDQSFVNMVVAIIQKYHKSGENFAEHFNLKK